MTERLAFDPGADDPFATLQLHLLGVVAHLERSLTRERQREGNAIGRANGVHRGRARTLTGDQVTEATRRAADVVLKATIAGTGDAHAGCCMTRWVPAARAQARRPTSTGR